MTNDLKVTLVKLAQKGWKKTGAKIGKIYNFSNFEDAFTFMTRCALEIEKLDHHPEWLNVYNKITVHLTTHDAGHVTAKDVELAKIMDRIATSFAIRK